MNSDTIFNVQEDIAEGKLSFRAIAYYYNISIDDVNTIWDEMCRQMDEGMDLDKECA
jgi:hypothetical protein